VVTRKCEHSLLEATNFDQRRIFQAQIRLRGFRKLHDPIPAMPLSEIAAGPCYAFCGIGNPQAFVDDLGRWHVTVSGVKAFRDHHRYSQSDATELETLAAGVGATALVTTEKDEQNLREVKFTKLPVYVAVIDFVLSSENEFKLALNRILSERRSPVA